MVRRVSVNFKISIGIFFILCTGIFSGCAPYSLPEKKSYSEQDDPYIYYAQSQEAYEKGDLQLAKKNINIALGLNNRLAQFYQLKGDIHRALAETDEAIEAYRSAINKRSNFLEVHLSLAELFEDLNRYEEAIRSYKRAAGLDPRDIDILLKIANCYIQWNEMSVANHFLNSYEKSAVEQNKELSNRYYVLRGEVLFLMNEYEHSLSFLDKVSEPDSLTIYLYGKNHYALGDFSTGVTYFNTLLKEDKNNGSWYFFRGIYFFEQKDYVDAKGQFRYAIELDSSLTGVHYYLGKILLIEGDIPAAIKEFELYQKNPEDSEKAKEIHLLLRSLKSEGDTQSES